MSLKNLIVKGKYYQYTSENPNLEDQIKHLNRIKQLIQHYLISTGFDDATPSVYNYANMTFYQHIDRTEEIEQKSMFAFLTKERREVKTHYLVQLNNVKNSAIWRVNVCCYPNDFYNKKAVFVEVTSEPAIIHKYQQLNYRPSLNQDDIDLIIFENTEFISQLAISILLNEFEKPKPLDSFVKTEVTIKLRNSGFEKIANLLEKGRKEIEEGKTENGLVDLRSALELFLVELIEKRNGVTNNQDKIKMNINELKKLGIIDDSIAKLLVAILVQGAYSNLSDTTHTRNSVDLFDARLYFDVIEKVFDYLIEKGVKYNINMAKTLQSS
jgi:hypothetical protein